MTMIPLEDFVAETLRQLITGVSKAQQETEGTSAAINPTGVHANPAVSDIIYRYDVGDIVERVRFDIAVTSVEGTGKKGGIGVFAGPLGIGAQGEQSATNQSTSRIQFSLTVAFPTYKPKL